MVNKSPIHVALVLSLLLVSLAAEAQSGLGKGSFRRYWTVESESPDYKVSFSGDTCELRSPKGLTLWLKQQLHAGMAVEYDAQVVVEGREGDRLSDLNCFWMASDPKARNLWQRMSWRSGIFTRCYSLQMYYMGYGGNHNTTTRFRRYTGNEAGIDDASQRPAILKEYTDTAHLLRPNHWYHVRLETARDGRTRFFVDGQLIVDYLDPEPLQSGWFGFRTTLSRTRITNCRIVELPTTSAASGIPLHWVGAQPALPQPVSFGIPFAQGELKDASLLTVTGCSPTDAWMTARWPDGSVKWAGLSTVIPAGETALSVKTQTRRKTKEEGMKVDETAGKVTITTERLQVFATRQGCNLIDSILIDGRKVCGAVAGTGTVSDTRMTTQTDSIRIERRGAACTVLRADGHHVTKQGRRWLPFTVRFYIYHQSEKIQMVYSWTYDGQENRDFIGSLGITLQVPMREAAYNRHIAFATDSCKVWTEPVQPLDGRRDLRLSGSPSEEGRGIPAHNLQERQMQGERIPPTEAFDDVGRMLISDWARWDSYRLSQLTDNSFSIRKRATRQSPWIGTLTGMRSPGYAFVGDVSGGMGVGMKDFWQSYPSTILVDGARTDEATVTMYLWSPEAEPMNLCHYDTVAHGLQAAYEDVQPGMSTPYGIARTSTLWLLPQTGYPGREAVAEQARTMVEDARLLPTPAYLHSRRAFGIWSLPSANQAVEQRLDGYISFYQQEGERCKWYGYWNYGDIMHALDPERGEWRYDVGGYAWDNTELATPMWLWLNFLRSGRRDVWDMAEAMTRHNSEVDTYHTGPLAPLGSRHNVSHWGCGAKEARISQSAFLRYYYYLTTDERTGDLMHAQTDADTLLWHLDPMRLAEPREKFPCSAPARLRIGPDWLAYAGNWFTEWERTGNTHYRDKLMNGMLSIASLPDGLFTGNKALGYHPDTGIISYDGEPGRRNTNHLLTIMGGFELISELMPSLPCKAFSDAWTDHARRYRQMAKDVSRNHFPVRRLDAFAAWHDRDPQRSRDVWQRLTAPSKGISTNDAALWSLDAIYMLEVIPQ